MDDLDFEELSQLLDDDDAEEEKDMLPNTNEADESDRIDDSKTDQTRDLENVDESEKETNGRRCKTGLNESGNMASDEVHANDSEATCAVNADCATGEGEKV